MVSAVETTDRVRIGVLISGSGTNLQSIMDASDEGRLDGDVVVVIANHDKAFGLERARKAGIPAVWVDRAAYRTGREYNEKIRDTLLEYSVELVAMAGYMRLLGSEVLEEFPDRVLNIHPSLLPAFAGASGIKDAFEYGVRYTGVTVHFANEEFDKGPIIAQEVVEIAEDDTLESLQERVHEVEHRLYPQVLQWMTEGRVLIEGRKTRIVPLTEGPVIGG